MRLSGTPKFWANQELHLKIFVVRKKWGIVFNFNVLLEFGDNYEIGKPQLIGMRI